MKIIINIKSLSGIMLATVMGVLPVAAQNLLTGFFNDEYVYRYQMNPAIANENNFISLPALGNFDFRINGTLGASDIFYNVDGRTTTFLNPNVSNDKAMSAFSDKNILNTEIRETIIAGGFKAFGGYNTITLGVRGSVGVRLPYDLFSLLKEGIENKTYDISDLSAYGNAYAELSLGHSHGIGSDFRVGANLKVLVGALGFKAEFDKANLALNENDWSVTAEGQLNSYVKGMRYKTAVNDRTGRMYVDGFDFDDAKYASGNIGVAVDLGVVYSPSAIDGLSVSAALVDLGFMNWGSNLVASTDGEQSFNTDKYAFSVDKNANNSFSKEWKNVRDALSNIYQLSDKGDQGSTCTSLGTTLNVGVSYALPAYRPLSFGLLNTTRMNGKFSWTNFRLSANIAPCKVFSASAAVSAGTFGVGFGWILNLHPKGFNLFAGMDHMMGSLAKNGVPLSSNASFNMGINFPF